jgi:hypothetical protein
MRELQSGLSDGHFAAQNAERIAVQRFKKKIEKFGQSSLSKGEGRIDRAVILLLFPCNFSCSNYPNN